MELKKGDIISPSRKTQVRETVVECDGVRVITCYERPDGRAEYFTREMRDVERYWEKTDGEGCGQWGGEQHKDYLRQLEAERKDEPGCAEVAAAAVTVVIAAGLLAYGCVRAGRWLL